MPLMANLLVKYAVGTVGWPRVSPVAGPSSTVLNIPISVTSPLTAGDLDPVSRQCLFCPISTNQPKKAR